MAQATEASGGPPSQFHAGNDTAHGQNLDPDYQVQVLVLSLSTWVTWAIFKAMLCLSFPMLHLGMIAAWTSGACNEVWKSVLRACSGGVTLDNITLPCLCFCCSPDPGKLPIPQHPETPILTWPCRAVTHAGL